MNLTQFNELKNELDEVLRNADRARGSLDQLKKELQERFGCSKLSEAEEILATLEADLEKEMTRYQKALEEFKSAYGHIRNQ